MTKGERFDLAILDMHMPELGGLELATALRSLDETMPMVLFSSLGRREVNDQDHLFAGYLSKPLHQSHLFDTLASLLREDEGAGADDEGSRTDRPPARREASPADPAWPRTTR